MMGVSPSISQTILSPMISPVSSPAPTPSPPYVDLSNLLTVAGPFHTFLRYLNREKLTETFQAQANNTDDGITIFVPTDEAFSKLKTPTVLSNLTKNQMRSLLLYHAIPQYYSLSEFTSLSLDSPITTTFAGAAYQLNITENSGGVIRIDSGWSNPKISSSVFSTKPVALYEIHRVLLPIKIFGTPPPQPPSPAPSPEMPGIPNDDVADSPDSKGDDGVSTHQRNIGVKKYCNSIVVYCSGLLLFLLL